MEHKNLEDVFQLVRENMDVFPKARELVISGMGSISPVTAGMAKIVSPFLTDYDEFKLRWFLIGLAGGLDFERKINELYIYAKKPQNAVLLGNIFKKVFSSETIKSCVLLGMLLSEHVTGEKEYERDELIICRALEIATDYDLENFKYIMENCIVEEKGVKKVEINNKIENASDFQITQNWCIFNRIFMANLKPYFTFEGESLGIMNPPTYVGSTAEKLYELIKKGQQIWNY